MECEAITRCLRDTLGQIWASTLNNQVTSLQSAESLELADLHCCMTTISLSGAWSGNLTLLTSKALSQRITKSIFKDCGFQLTSAEIEDALKEILNIVGGNLKAHLPEPTALSVPEYLDVGPEQLLDQLPEIFMRFDYRSEDEPFTILIQKSASDISEFESFPFF